MRQGPHREREAQPALSVVVGGIVTIILISHNGESAPSGCGLPVCANLIRFVWQRKRDVTALAKGAERLGGITPLCGVTSSTEAEIAEFFAIY